MNGLVGFDEDALMVGVSVSMRDTVPGNPARNGLGVRILVDLGLDGQLSLCRRAQQARSSPSSRSKSISAKLEASP